MHSDAAPARGRGVRAFLHAGLAEPRAPRAYAARGRSAVLNQLVLCALVLIVATVGILSSTLRDQSLFLVGVVIIFAVGMATLAVPWTRMPRVALYILPLADIAGIAVIRVAEPMSGLGLMWVFPAMWLATLGVVGFVLQFTIITAAYTVIVVSGGTTVWGYTTFLLPAAVLAVATTTFISSRRQRAQAHLLEKQAALLSGALQRAQRQEELVIDVLDAVDFGVLRIAPDGTVSVVNEALGRFQNTIPGFGSRSREIENAYRADGVTPLPREERPLLRALAGEVFENQVVWFGHPDERRHAMSITVRRMHDAEGADAGAVLIARDVTPEMTAMRARDRLVASVSHELRTPLTSVLGYLDLALDTLDDPEQARHSLEIAARNGERLLEIVADILAASSASRLSIDMTISPEPIDVAELMAATAEAWRPRAAERALTIDTSGIEPARAFADPLRLRQVMDNLVSNAVKYNRDGGAIFLGCTTDGDSTWILVRDTGTGIAEPDLGRLFERYFRARTDVEGTGLGLSISRDIARAHGGDITVQTSRGLGSTFMVQLPADERPQPSDAAPGEETGDRG
ncbi:signal transduction histidine kinase [Microbacterium sp. SORGH_AS428]|uniref:ATP-binding protein n=1 Tax=Microbacterium sp. SORGH_AS_0428 TaxID=3041788 RepID=UPI002856C37E|nr:ATP-binding protein [Microbacterium sp. SORGH_AS_0428]MDR6198305.1 signal transduction histidine kinase [Microbacterium sp. SORGH_AS_0428]